MAYNSSVYNPILTYVRERDVGCCILNCFMPSSLLVSLLFEVLLSLHLHTFYTCLPHFCSGIPDSITATQYTILSSEVQSCSLCMHTNEENGIADEGIVIECGQFHQKKKKTDFGGLVTYPSHVGVSRHNCPVCENAIRETKGRSKGQDAVFCDGSCQMWLHRCCAGLSRKHFEAVASSEELSLCPACQRGSQQETITLLKDDVAALLLNFSS